MGKDCATRTRRKQDTKEAGNLIDAKCVTCNQSHACNAFGERSGGPRSPRRVETLNESLCCIRYAGPTFWEVCEEQWPRTFRVLGHIWAVLRRFRGLVALIYVTLTFFGVRHLWRTRLLGLFGGGTGQRLTS